MTKISVRDFDAPNQYPTFLSAPAIAPTGGELQQLIKAPDSQGTLDTFLQSLTVRDIIFECEGDGPLAQHPGFPGAVRQAIGSQLMKTASREALAGLPCPWSPACGFQIFVNSFQSSNQEGQSQLTSPWSLRCETADATSVRITLRLFGLGLLWGSELADACHRAVESGIYIGGMGPVCDSVIIRSVENVWTGLECEDAETNRAMVSFVTPFHCDDQQSDLSVGELFMRGLLRRASDIAIWHGVRVDHCLDELKSLIEACEINEAGLNELKWNRAVSQKRSASIAMKGYTGLMQIRLPEEGRSEIIQLLRLGELLHSGDMLAFGQGRYELYLF
nr:CRISPR system precrRNA processing endoribonuclease RAMP protein Cas6 [uncultured Cohaesibacter sp.]